MMRITSSWHASSISTNKYFYRSLHQVKSSSSFLLLVRRAVDIHGSSVDIFPLPADEETLESLLRDLFEHAPCGP
jgi:hypothetical protein